MSSLDRVVDIIIRYVNVSAAIHCDAPGAVVPLLRVVTQEELVQPAGISLYTTDAAGGSASHRRCR